MKDGDTDATCATLEVPLKPLNLHERINSLTQQELEQLPMSEIKLSGSFSQSDALQWVSNCIPNVPTVLGESQDQSVSFTFKSSFTKTFLVVEIRDGQIMAKSDNFSVITIVKDQLSSDASHRKIKLEIQSNLNQESI